MNVWVTIKQAHGITWQESTAIERCAQLAFNRLATDNDRAESAVAQYEIDLDALTVHCTQRKTPRQEQ